jgi:hypothetical protein
MKYFVPAALALLLAMIILFMSKSGAPSAKPLEKAGGKCPYGAGGIQGLSLQ